MSCHQAPNHALKIKAQGGVALLTVLVAVAVLTVLAFEISYSTGIQSRLARTFYAGGQAKYLNKSALNISLMRVYFYMNLMNILKSADVGISPQDLAPLYNIPLPPFPFDTAIMGMMPVAIRIGLERFLRESVLGEMPNVQFAADIRGLSGLIPINLLDGEPERFSSLKFQNVLRGIVERLIENYIYDNEDWWYRDYRDIIPEDLTWGLINYIDLDNIEKPTGNVVDIYFQQFDPPEYLRHRRIQHPAELELPRSWNHEIAGVFGRYFNLYAFYPYININNASSQIYRALFQDPSEDQMDALRERLIERKFVGWSDLQEFMRIQDVGFHEAYEDLHLEAIQKLTRFYEQVAFEIRTKAIVEGIEYPHTAIVVFKPSLSRFETVKKHIETLSLNSQRQMMEAGDFENPEYQKWKEDPFGFFAKDDDRGDDGRGQMPPAGQARDRGSGRDASPRQQKPAASQYNIFEDDPEVMEIAYWGHPI